MTGEREGRTDIAWGLGEEARLHKDRKPGYHERKMWVRLGFIKGRRGGRRTDFMRGEGGRPDFMRGRGG